MDNVTSPPVSPSPPPPPPPPSSPPVVVRRIQFPRPRWHSHDPLFHKIKSFLHYGYFFDSEDLVIPLDCCSGAFSAFQDELRNHKILTEAEALSLRYTFNPDTTTLIIRPISSPVHDAIVHLVIFMKEAMVSRGFLAGSEARNVCPIFGTTVVLPRRYQLPKDDGAKSSEPTYLVSPDAAFAFADREDPDRNPILFPRVIFEVAVSQSYECVLENARQWLLRGWGFIKVVVVIKLYENMRESERGNPEGSGSGLDVHCPVKGARSESSHVGNVNHGVHKDRSSYDVDDAATLPPPNSSFTEKLPVKDDETSPSAVSGFIEIYRYNEATGSPYRDGDRVDIFATDIGPEINIKDLLPGDHIIGDDNRSYTIPLNLYRQYIKVGSQLARVRKVLKQKKLVGSVDHSKFVSACEQEDKSS